MCLRQTGTFPPIPCLYQVRDWHKQYRIKKEFEFYSSCTLEQKGSEPLFLELSLLKVCYKSVCALHLRYVKIRHKDAMPHFFKLLRIKTFSITFFWFTFCATVNLFLRQPLKGNLKAAFLVFRLIQYIKT